MRLKVSCVSSGEVDDMYVKDIEWMLKTRVWSTERTGCIYYIEGKVYKICHRT